MLPYGDYHALIECMRPHLPKNPVIIEGGAYCGKTTALLARAWPAGIIHAFEPVPTIYTRLCKNVNQYPQVHCYQLALSDTIGSAILYLSEEPKIGFPAQSSSLLKPKDHYNVSPLVFRKEITVDTTTLDHWAAQQGIEHIDCLWLAVQGATLAVLKAAPKTLARVTALALQVEFIEVYQGQFLFDDIGQWLATHGFVHVATQIDAHTQNWFGMVIFVKNG